MQTSPYYQEYTATPISRLVVSWVLLIPLIYIAGDGGFWFIGAEDNGRLAAVYGSLVSDPRKTLQNAILSVLIFGIVGMLLFPRFKAVMALVVKQKVFGALAVLALASCLWSQFPIVSLMWAPVAALNVVLAFYLYQRFSPERQMRLLLMLGWICLFTNIILSLFFPQYGIDHSLEKTLAWRGMCTQKNQCSMITSFLLPAAFYVPARDVLSKFARVIFVGLSVLVIIMTHSATGLIALAFLFLFVGAMRFVSRLSTRDRTIALIAGGSLSLVVVAVMLTAGTQILLLLGRDPTLTGRTVIWESIIPAIMQHPLLGYGYQGFWRGYEGASANIALTNGWAVSSAHNSFLQVGLDLGFVGIALVAYSLILALRDSFLCLRAVKNPYFTWCACIVLISIVTGMDEVAYMVPNSPVWLIFMLACVGLSEGAAQLAPQRQLEPNRRLELTHG